MNEFKLSADDPRLTAYALGELEEAARVEVEKALRTDPAAQAIVDEIRRTAAQLEAAFAAEAEEPEAVAKSGAADPYATKRIPALLRFPQVYYVVGTLAAACFAVLLALHTPTPAGRRPVFEEKRVITAVNLPSVTDAPAENAAAGRASAAGGTNPPQSSDTLKKPQPNFTEQASALLDKSKRVDLTADVDAAKNHTFAVPAPVNPIATGNLELKGLDPAEVIAERQRAAEASARQHASATKDNAVRAQELQYVASASAKIPGYPRDEKIALEDRASLNRKEEQIQLSPFEVSTSPMPARAARFTAEANTLAGSRMPAQVFGAVRSAPAVQSFNTETYDYRKESDFVSAADNPLSTFSIDVDTASYANVRRFIQSGRLPPPDAVRIEELLNYFPYRYAGPESRRDDGVAATGEGAPFAASMETAEAPWAPGHRLVRIGLKGREVAASERGAANLVFLLDVSGSMNMPHKLPLVKESMRMLVERLRKDDRVAIVTYAGASGLALPSTPVAKAREITEAIDELTPGGSTNGAMGIQLAYDIAKANFIAGGINRVILCTDGDFNVGVTSPGDLVRLITEKAKSGVFLTALGFGMGNYKDSTLQQLADAGNGNYGYIDQRREAEKLLVEQVSGTLVTIAKDVKIQVEFNPAQVARYRLIGYEKRRLQKEDFNNDTVDAGEIGAGHTVTALYEIIPVGAEAEAAAGGVDELRYATTAKPATDARADRSGRGDEHAKGIERELLTLKLRYKEPAGQISKKLEFPLIDRGRGFAEASADFKFASAVAAFGMILRDSQYRGNATLADVAGWAESGASPDPGGYRAEFLQLVEQARHLM